MLNPPSLSSTGSSPSQSTQELAFSSPALRLWGWPVLLGLLSASGLLSALVSDGWGDAWSWLGLGVPVLVMGWFSLRRRPLHPSSSFQKS